MNCKAPTHKVEMVLTTLNKQFYTNLESISTVVKLSLGIPRDNTNRMTPNDIWCMVYKRVVTMDYDISNYLIDQFHRPTEQGFWSTKLEKGREQR